MCGGSSPELPKEELRAILVETGGGGDEGGGVVRAKVAVPTRMGVRVVDGVI